MTAVKEIFLFMSLATATFTPDSWLLKFLLSAFLALGYSFEFFAIVYCCNSQWDLKCYTACCYSQKICAHHIIKFGIYSKNRIIARF